MANLQKSTTPGSDESLSHRLLFPLAIFLLVFSIGTLGYRLIMLYTGQDRNLWDCFYQMTILLTGIGLTDHLESYSSIPGILFTVVMSFFGVGFLLWFMSTVTAFIVSGELRHAVRRKKMLKRIGALRDHFIVCGCGETGQHCIRELLETKRPFVVLENDSNRIDELRRSVGDFLFIAADASDDDVLRSAGIEYAKGLLSSLPSDKDNLLVAITARQLNPSIRIISRCAESSNAAKLRKAGADSVVCPNMIGGLRLVSEMVRPQVVSFLDVMLRDRRKIRIEEATVTADSPQVGKTIAEANLHEIADINVIAVRSPEASDFTYNPRGNTPLTADTILVLIGTPDAIRSVQDAVAPS
jgi:voltage-gated potassium channel